MGDFFFLSLYFSGNFMFSVMSMYQFLIKLYSICSNMCRIHLDSTNYIDKYSSVSPREGGKSTVNIYSYTYICENTSGFYKLQS